jgi:hypothetical protein
MASSLTGMECADSIDLRSPGALRKLVNDSVSEIRPKDTGLPFETQGKKTGHNS